LLVRGSSAMAEAAWAEESHTPVPSETSHEILRAKEALQDDSFCKVQLPLIRAAEISSTHS
jgi:hypothetical protein